MNAKNGRKAEAPTFTGERLLIVGTGAIAVMHLPFWFNWLRVNYPDLEVQFALTSSAARLVSPHALSVAAGREVVVDVWPAQPETTAPHVRLVEWADTAMVYPAGLNFVARLALGLADTPALMALQCTTVPLGVAPSLPAGALANPVVTGHLETLARRPNVVVAPTEAARSLSTGRADTAGAVPVWRLLGLLEDRRRELARSTVPAAEPA